MKYKFVRPDYKTRLRPVIKGLLIALLCVPTLAMVTLGLVDDYHERQQYNKAAQMNEKEFRYPNLVGSRTYSKRGAVCEENRTYTFENGCTERCVDGEWTPKEAWLGCAEQNEIKIEPNEMMQVNGSLHVVGRCGTWMFDSNSSTHAAFVKAKPLPRGCK